MIMIKYIYIYLYIIWRCNSLNGIGLVQPQQDISRTKYIFRRKTIFGVTHRFYNDDVLGSERREDDEKTLARNAQASPYSSDIA